MCALRDAAAAHAGAHLYFLCLDFGWRSRRAASLQSSTVWITQKFPFEFCWKGLVWSFACELELVACAARNCVREHNREPAVSNVHLYGYYHGPWGVKVVGGTFAGQICYFSAGIGGFLQRERFGSQSVNGVRTNLRSHNHTAEQDQPEPANKDKQ